MIKAKEIDGELWIKASDHHQAIKEALAQTQEPVTWADYESNGMHHKPVAWMDADGNVSDNNDHKFFPIPLYTHPPQRTEQEPVALQYLQKDIDWQREQQIKAQASTPPQRTWVGLTDEEIFETHKQVDSMQYLTFANAIEAKLKEKNT